MDSTTNTKKNITAALIEKYKSMHDKWDDDNHMLVVLKAVLENYKPSVFEQAVLWLSNCDKVGPKCKEILKDIIASFGENVKKDPDFNMSCYGLLDKLHARIYRKERRTSHDYSFLIPSFLF